MLQHPDTLYRVHRLRHQELIAEADRFRLANHTEGSRARQTGLPIGLFRRAAALTRTVFHRVAPERGVLPQFDDGPAQSAS
jgi:hypothetical protein